MPLPNGLLLCPICDLATVVVKSVAPYAQPGHVHMRCAEDREHVDIVVQAPDKVLQSYSRRIQWFQQQVFRHAKEIPEDAVTVLGKMQQQNDRIEELEKRLKCLAGPVLDRLIAQADRWHEHHCRNGIDSWWQCWRGPCTEAVKIVRSFREFYETARDIDQDALRRDRSR